MVKETESVSKRAYALWEAAGRPEGEADRFWQEAEREAGGPVDDPAGHEASARHLVRDIDSPGDKDAAKAKKLRGEARK